MPVGCEQGERRQLLTREMRTATVISWGRQVAREFEKIVHIDTGNRFIFDCNADDFPISLRRLPPWG